MTRKRNPIQDKSTFGVGIPFEPIESNLHYSPEKRILPSQFPFTEMPMNCTFIKNAVNFTDTQKQSLS